MKCSILIVFLLIATPVFADDSPSSYGMRWDRIMHGQFGFGISASTILWGEKYFGINKNYSWIWGILLSTAVGFGKEIADNRGNFDVRDWSQDSRWDVVSFATGGFFGFCWTRTF